MSLRAWTLTVLGVSMFAALVAVVAPWHHPAGAEWDDGEHVWGTNIYDTSIFVTGLGDDAPMDADGVLLRQLGFGAYMAGLFFASMAFVFALADRRAWALSLGWPAWVLLGAGAGGVIGGMMYEFAEAADLRPGIGLFALGAALLLMFVGNIMGSWLGTTPAAQKRRKAALERKAAKKQARIEAKQAVNTDAANSS